MRRSRHRRRTGGGLVPLIAVLTSAGAAGYFYYVRPGQVPGIAPAAPTQPGVSQAATLDPAPLPQASPERSEPSEPVELLPPLADSDGVVRTALEALWGKQAVARLLVPDDLVSRFVATIDSLPNSKIALKLRPVQPLEGAALVRRDPGSPARAALGEEHFARYAPLMHLVEATSADQLEAMYLRFHPLLQQAYEDLGYPGESFDERLVGVIDHLLQTPDLPAPIAVVRPKVYYEFADRALEERSAGQKLLIRMGPRNAAVVKQRLRELRALLK